MGVLSRECHPGVPRQVAPFIGSCLGGPDKGPTATSRGLFQGVPSLGPFQDTLKAVP